MDIDDKLESDMLRHDMNLFTNRIRSIMLAISFAILFAIVIPILITVLIAIRIEILFLILGPGTDK